MVYQVLVCMKGKILEKIVFDLKKVWSCMSSGVCLPEGNDFRESCLKRGVVLSVIRGSFA